MTDRAQPNDDQKLEAYLDGSLSESERLAFEEVLQSDAAQAAQVHLQERIDASLARLFATTPPSEEQVQAFVAAAVESADRSLETGRRRRLLWIAGLAAAASIAGIVALLNLGDGQKRSPFFEPLPVARLYHKAVADGFEPYYECRDDERFAAVFARRQGVPLRLKPMPPGSRMLGLSYPGGLSRKTTAMLCEVDGEPVMVFVDREDADLETASDRDENSPHVNVFRVVRNGLVFYEVTPFPGARVIEYLVVTNPPADAND